MVAADYPRGSEGVAMLRRCKGFGAACGNGEGDEGGGGEMGEGDEGMVRILTMEELLPMSFGPEHLGKRGGGA